MQRRIGVILGALLLAIGASVAAAAPPGASVVRVEADGHVGSGFAWSQPGYIVTALHVVAGAKKVSVYAESVKKRSRAQVVATLHEADLALLKLERDLGLTPLNHAAADANDSADHFVWGYPHDVAEMTRHRVQIVGGLNAAPRLSSIFRSDSQLKRTLGAQGYPQLDSRIIRVDKIQPGHSGAPLVNAAGEVIGIGDGGLRDGLGGLNWAVPAAEYLPRLRQSRDPIPTAASLQSGLFSAAAENADDPTAAIRIDSGSTLRRVWSAPLEEIIDLVDDELRDTFEEIVAEAREMTGSDISGALIDVYEDEASGATFAAPRGSELVFDAEHGLLGAAAPGGARLLVQIRAHADWQAAAAQIERFGGFLMSTREDWIEDPELPDERENDPQDEFAALYINRVGGWYDESFGDWTSLMEASLLADGEFFLGTAVIAEDNDAYAENDWRDYYLMAVCVELADFADY